MPFTTEQKRAYRGSERGQAIQKARAADQAEQERQREKRKRYTTEQSDKAVAYRDRERMRNSKRHHKEWHYHDAIIAVCDGEADDNGSYRWLQVRAVDRTYTLTAPEGRSISFTRAAYWMLALRTRLKRENKTDHVYFYWFAFGYDMDQLIGHDNRIAPDHKKQLIKHRSKDFGLLRYPGWSNEVVLPNSHLAVHNGRKEVQIRYLHRDERGDYIVDDTGTPTSFTTMTHYDVYTLSAKSFATLMNDMTKCWTADERERYQPLLERVVSGKAARGKFAETGMDVNDILAYNESELILLEWYMRKLVALCESDAVQLAPRTFAGPAPLARALLTKYGTTEHVKPENYDTLDFQHSQIFRLAKYAYYGGNIQLAGWGELQSFYLYDIHSAYPAAISNLPCVAHGRWQMNICTPPITARTICCPFAIYHIAWRTEKHDRFGPFPVRRKDGSIFYPLTGEGWYHSPEVQAYIDGNRGRYTIDSCLTWIPECNNNLYPFRTMARETYEERARLKKSGDAGELVLKLALNSVYGLFAQRSGSHLIFDGFGKPVSVSTPKFSNLYAAGWVTSTVRSQLYRIYCDAPDGVFGFATDSVYSFHRLPNMRLGDEIGMWEEKNIEEPTAFVAPGVVLSASQSYQRTRGMPRSDHLYQMITEARAKGEEYIVTPGSHYVDLRMAYASVNPHIRWGVFAEHTRKLAIDGKALKTKRDWLRQNDVRGLHICASYFGTGRQGESYELFKEQGEIDRDKEEYDA